MKLKLYRVWVKDVKNLTGQAYTVYTYNTHLFIVLQKHSLVCNLYGEWNKEINALILINKVRKKDAKFISLVSL